MRFREIMRDIRGLHAYTPELFSEYVSYFSEGNSILEYLLEQDADAVNSVAERIQAMQGASPVEPDYVLSNKILRNNLPAGVRRETATLGIVSGCFDLLHLGHIRGISYAKQFLRQYPNPLLIALTLSDANIRTKKGKSRPVLNLNERLEMLCNVECVDYVIPLEEPNCLVLLNKLRPDCFFKAYTDRSQDIVRKEVELVEFYGGELVVFPARPDGVKSTTKLIESVVEKMMREW